MVKLNCFKKENLHCVWDDSLAGKYVICSDSLDRLLRKLEDEKETTVQVIPSPDPGFPFIDRNGVVWKFAYEIHEATTETGDDPVKQAFMDGDSVSRRYGDEEWEPMSDTSYFDVPGYEYKVIGQEPQYRRATNKELAMWLAKGKGILLDVRSQHVTTTYTFELDDMLCSVPDNYRVMLVDTVGSEWLDPTVGVILIE